MKRPSFQFYPADWRKDAALQSCSVAAQGLWINILCIAHECDPYGHMTVNGKPMNAAQIGRLVGMSAKECSGYLAELQDAGVSSVAEDGSIYSRRMVRDEKVRETRAEIGRQHGIKGKEFGAMGAEHGGKGGRPKGEKTPGDNPPRNPRRNPPKTPALLLLLLLHLRRKRNALSRRLARTMSASKPGRTGCSCGRRSERLSRRR
ncbi:hypothetical protein [Variovorax sp. PAMC 28711]|uniref:hypothetical protein n=1 Tax=Variovorax sp. PAMC 28711 TaxID=1795631 RepID=UPI0012E73141|nr:hypothetical protein [Variovorax sp. PAMC 28711]